jgi:GTPase SAR1 family protein
MLMNPFLYHRALAPMYYRNADAAVLVYDVTDADSFDMLQSWYHELQKNVPDCIIVLAGNKIDLDSQRKVRTLEHKSPSTSRETF